MPVSTVTTPAPELDEAFSTTTPMSAAAPMCTVSDACPAMICLAMDSAWLIGMANPSVPAWNWNPLEAAVSMPITTPGS